VPAHLLHCGRRNPTSMKSKFRQALGRFIPMLNQALRGRCFLRTASPLQLPKLARDAMVGAVTIASSGWSIRLTRRSSDASGKRIIMDKHTIHEHHTKAAEHHEHAAKHHREAAEHDATSRLPSYVRAQCILIGGYLPTPLRWSVITYWP
jgi:hypothetical protein